MEIIVILLLAFSQSFTHEWIDPYDMNIYSEINVKSVKTSETHKDNCFCSSNDDISLPYLKRFVSLLINSATYEDVNSNIKIGKFVLNSETEDFKFLIEFNNKKVISNDELRKLDIIISSLFEKKNISDHVFETFLSTQKFINFLLGRNWITVIGISLGLYITFYLLKSKFSFWYITKYFFLVIIIIDYGFRYQTLLEEAEDHNTKLEYSSVCDTSKMTWTEWFKFVRSHQNCEKMSVTPVEVAMLQVKHLIIIPFSAFGTAMGKFGTELWKELPFPWNILIFPIMLIFIILIFAITIMAINNSPIKIALFHLINFEFGQHQVDNRNHVSGDTLDKLLDAVTTHRPMVEDQKLSLEEVSEQIADKSRKSKSVRREKKEQCKYSNDENTSPNDVNSEERTEISIKPAVNSKDDLISRKDTTSPKETTVKHNSPQNK